MVTCWMLWKWRNMNLFDEDVTLPQNPLEIISSTIFSVPSEHNSKGKQIRNIALTFPPQDWIKLNTDGSSKGNPGGAWCGGIRKDNGHWILGFTYHIGFCSARTAELWGIYIGLLRAYC